MTYPAARDAVVDVAIYELAFSTSRWRAGTGELSVAPIVIRVASLVPAVSFAPAVMTTPGSTADVDHRRRGIVRSRLIDHRRRVSSKDERVDADTDMHLRACSCGCAKRKSRKDK